MRNNCKHEWRIDWHSGNGVFCVKCYDLLPTEHAEAILNSYNTREQDTEGSHSDTSPEVK